MNKKGEGETKYQKKNRKNTNETKQQSNQMYKKRKKNLIVVRVSYSIKIVFKQAAGDGQTPKKKKMKNFETVEATNKQQLNL